jgi:hypothetical protein
MIRKFRMFILKLFLKHAPDNKYAPQQIGLILGRKAVQITPPREQE